MKSWKKTWWSVKFEAPFWVHFHSLLAVCTLDVQNWEREFQLSHSASQINNVLEELIPSPHQTPPVELCIQIGPVILFQYCLLRGIKLWWRINFSSEQTTFQLSGHVTHHLEALRLIWKMYYKMHWIKFFHVTHKSKAKYFQTKVLFADIHLLKLVLDICWHQSRTL